MENDWVIRKGYSSTGYKFGFYAIHENCKYKRLDETEAIGDYVYKGHYRPNSCAICTEVWPKEILMQINLLNQRKYV